MDQYTAGDAKQRFGEMLDAAQRSPVGINKHGRPVAVVVSHEEYERIQAMKQEALEAAIQVGMDDIKAGRVHDHDTVFAEIRKRFHERTNS